MSLFKRFNDIISANLNDMVESFEDPEKMLKQAVREMETSIEDAKRNVAKTMASEKLVARELAENERLVTQWQSRAENAAQASDDDLARKAIRRKKEHEQVVAALTDQHAAAVEASLTLRRQLEAMQAKLADAKRRLGTLVARKKSADVRSRVQGLSDPHLNVDAFAKFDRLREKVELAEAEADAMRELCGNAAVGAEEIPEPNLSSVDLDVDAEFEALKRKMRK